MSGKLLRMEYGLACSCFVGPEFNSLCLGRILAVGTTSICQPFLHFVVIVREDEDDELISFCMPLIAAADGPPWSSV